MRKFLPLFLLLLGLPAFAQSTGIIASGRVGPWSSAGATIATNRTQCGSTIAAGATTATINAAIAACPANELVLLGVGTFSGIGALNIHVNNVTLRGSGPNSTFIIFANGTNCGLGSQGGNLCVSDSTAYYNGTGAVLPPSGTHQMAWTAGFTPGTSTITGNSCGSGCVAPVLGQTIILDQADDSTDNGGIFVCGLSTCNNEGSNKVNGRTIAGVTYNQQLVVKVTSISGSGTGPYTIGISPSLYGTNWAKGSTNGIWWPGTITGVGIENLSLDSRSNTSGAGNITTLYDCLGCWYLNVRSIQPNGQSHVLLYQSANDTVANSYMFGSPGAEQSYGVQLFETSDDLVINNIFQQVASPSAAGNGLGNVWAYNFSIYNLFTSDNWMQVTYSSHSPAAMYNLYEGNVLNGLDNDDDWGTSPLNTYFRNRSDGYEEVNSVVRSQNTIGHRLDWGSRGTNIVGDVIGTSGFDTTYETSSAVNSGSVSNAWLSIYTLGYQTVGSIPVYGTSPTDSLVRSTLCRWGNYDTVNALNQFNGGECNPSATGSGATQIPANPTPANDSLPPSFFLTAVPSFFGSAPWPPIGPDVMGGNIPNVGGHAYQIPAENCYQGLTGATSDGTGSVLPFPGTCYPAYYSITNMPPATWYPWPVSPTPLTGAGPLFNTQISAVVRAALAGAATPSVYCFLNNCATAVANAKYSITNNGSCSETATTASGNACGLFLIAQPNSAADSELAIYPSQPATDPFYKINASGVNVTFQCPSAAVFGGSTADQTIDCFDQTQNLLVEMYAYDKGAGFNLGSCSGTLSSPCTFTGFSYASALRVNTDPSYYAGQNFSVLTPASYTLGGVGTSNIGLSPIAGAIRFSELLAGHIYHALAIDIPCSNPSYLNNFPNTNSVIDSQCSPSAANQPVYGGLYTFDYTNAQLSTICAAVALWKCATITAATQYGMFPAQTGGSAQFYGFVFEECGSCGESLTAYQALGVPFASSPIVGINAQGGWGPTMSSYTSGATEGYLFDSLIPRIVNASSTSSDLEGNACNASPGCYPSGHAIFLNACVAKGMAQVAGSCLTNTTSGPSPFLIAEK